MDINREIKKQLLKIKSRLYLILLTKYILLSVILSFLVVSVLLIVSKFYPIYITINVIYYIVIGALLIAFLISLFIIPSDNSCAKKVDSLGLNERVITALEFKEDDTQFALLVKEDTLKHLSNFNIKKQISFNISKRYLITPFILLCFLVILYIIPNPMGDRALLKHKLNIGKKEEVQKIVKVEKDIKNNVKLDSWKKTELLNKLEDLKKEVKFSKNENDINKALQKSEKKLEALKDNYTDENLNKLIEALKKNDATKDIGELLKNGNKEQAKKEIEKLSQSLKNMTKDERKDLADSLSKLANEIKDNKELQDALISAAKGIENLDLSGLDGEISELSNSVAKLMEDSELNEAIEKISKEMAQAQNDLQDKSENKSQGGISDEDGGAISGNQGQNPGNNSGNNGSGGSGGNGGTQGGNGTDLGQENPNVSGTPQNGNGIGKKTSSEKKIGEYEKIFTPRNLGGDGEKSEIKGQKNSTGSSSVTKSNEPNAVIGDLVPYNSVIGEYKKSAQSSVENDVIPDNMKDIVKDYFTSLED